MFTMNPEYFKNLADLKTGDLPLLIESKSKAEKMTEKLLEGRSLPQVLPEVDQLLELFAAHNLPRLSALNAEEIHQEYIRNRLAIEKLISLAKKDLHAPE